MRNPDRVNLPCRDIARPWVLRARPAAGDPAQGGNERKRMTSDEYDAASAQTQMVTGAWQAGLFLGVVTLILGLIVALHPSGSLNVIAVLLGILMIVSGLFHLIRVFDPREAHRVWLGVAGLLFIVIGVDPHPPSAPDPGDHRPGHRHHLDRSGGGRAHRRDRRRRSGRKGLVDLLRRGEPGRGDRGHRYPRLVGQRPRHPARNLVHHHGHLRDHRVVHTPARTAHRGPARAPDTTPV